MIRLFFAGVLSVASVLWIFWIVPVETLLMIVATMTATTTFIVVPFMLATHGRIATPERRRAYVIFQFFLIALFLLALLRMDWHTHGTTTMSVRDLHCSLPGSPPMSEGLGPCPAKSAAQAAAEAAFWGRPSSGDSPRPVPQSGPDEL